MLDLSTKSWELQFDIDLQPERDTKDATRLKRVRLPAKKKAPSKKPGTRRQRD
jgi:hypothetical protein